jgi:hypothetical protein
MFGKSKLEQHAYEKGHRIGYLTIETESSLRNIVSDKRNKMMDNAQEDNKSLICYLQNLTDLINCALVSVSPYMAGAPS